MSVIVTDSVLGVCYVANGGLTVSLIVTDSGLSVPFSR